MRSTHGMRNAAVAGVIEALLLVALVAIIISMIQLVYIPQVMEQREADHMDQVFNQFSSLKAMVDMQGTARSFSPISSMLPLGSPRLPYFLTVPGQGRIVYEASSRITVNPAPYDEKTHALFPAEGLNISCLHYEAENAYFVDQEYILEGGGIVMQQQGSRSVMLADPSVSDRNESSLILRIDLPVFMEKAGKAQAEGEGKCFIRTNYSSNRTYVDLAFHGIIRIYTDYVTAWNQTLHDILGVYHQNGYLTISLDPDPSPQYVEITALTKKNVELHLNIINIYVQIGPGWVE